MRWLPAIARGVSFGQNGAKGSKVGDGMQESEREQHMIQLRQEKPVVIAGLHESAVRKAKSAKTRAKVEEEKTARATKSAKAKAEMKGNASTRRTHMRSRIPGKTQWPDPWPDWSHLNVGEVTSKGGAAIMLDELGYLLTPQSSILAKTWV